MNLWKAKPLKDRRSIISRFWFRIFHGGVGAIIGFVGAIILKISIPSYIWMQVAIFYVFVVCGGGIFSDNWRLKHPNESSKKLTIIAALFITLILFAMVFSNIFVGFIKR